jgi:hypothetical protein
MSILRRGAPSHHLNTDILRPPAPSRTSIFDFRVYGLVGRHGHSPLPASVSREEGRRHVLKRRLRDSTLTSQPMPQQSSGSGGCGEDHAAFAVEWNREAAEQAGDLDAYGSDVRFNMAQRSSRPVGGAR